MNKFETNVHRHDELADLLNRAVAAVLAEPALQEVRDRMVERAAGGRWRLGCGRAG